MDAQPIDAEPVVDCLGVVPLANNGLGQGNTTNQPAIYEGGCFTDGAREVVFGMTLPGRARSLTINANNPNATFDPALHVYRDACLPQDRVGCAGTDVDGYFAELTLEQVEGGNYAIVVDGDEPGTSGSFVLSVHGVIAAGEACDPSQTFLTCQVGPCTMTGTTGYACPPLKDCPDGIDADDDGMLDEDTCDNPPVVACNGPTTAVPGTGVLLSATATDDGGITSREWTILERPFGSRAAAIANSDNLFFTTDLFGAYRARYVAYDAEYQTGACEEAVSATTAADLYAEVFWLDEPYDNYDLDLVMIHPMSPDWSDLDLACTYNNECAVTWGAQWSGDAPASLTAAESIRLDVGETVGAYGIGVGDYLEAPRQIYVNVYCGGTLRQTFGPMLLTEGSFWKVADVSLQTDGCSLTPLNVIVPQSQADVIR